MPIALGYLPAAFAFGAAATGIGLGVAEVGAMSAIVFSGANQAFLLAAIPAMAKLASSNRDAYDYLAESILAWPDQPHLADMMAEAGWQAIAWRNVCGGVVALHRGWKGSDEKEMA